MSSKELQPGRVNPLRRSQRVCLSVPILVIKNAEANPSSEQTRTKMVSAHGALLNLRLPVKAGDTLTIRHIKTEEQLLCRVVTVGPEQSGRRDIGVEFEQPSPRFWRVAFPPADWSPHSAEAKPPTTHQPTPPAVRKRTALRAGSSTSVSSPAETEKKPENNASGTANTSHS